MENSFLQPPFPRPKKIGLPLSQLPSCRDIAKHAAITLKLIPRVLWPSAIIPDGEAAISEKMSRSIVHVVVFVFVIPYSMMNDLRARHFGFPKYNVIP